MLISAVICTYRRYEVLGEVLSSVLAQDVGAGRYEIVVVDNSPDAALSDAAARPWRALAEAGMRAGTGPSLIWQHAPTPGLSHARNMALTLARAPLVAFLDDDAVADPGWLAGLVAAFGALGPGVHAVGGRVRLRLGVPRPAWLDDSLMGFLSACDLGPDTRRIGAGEWVVGANIAYRSDAVRAVGGFDTSLGRVGGAATLMSNDETDLQHRLAAAGGATGYAPNAAVEHIVAGERLRQAWFRRRAAWQAISDFVHDPATLQSQGDAAWARAKSFLAGCPPSLRTLRALAVHEPAPDRFQRQVHAVYDTVHAVLAGLDDLDD